MRDDVSFFFQDVNFDGTDELIVNEKGLGQRGWDRYRVYLLDKNGRLLPASQQITYKQPFVDFDAETCFDVRKRSVTTYAVGGASDFIYRTYQISNKATTKTYNKYILTLIDEWVAGVHTTNYQNL